MKNLVIIHLESLSKNLFFHASEEVFPNLNQIFEKSCFFTNYYSTATSTIMTIGDLMYGDMFQLEKAHNLNDVYKQKTINSLFEILEREDYQTSVCIYPRFPRANRRDRTNLKKIFGKATNYNEISKVDQFHDKIANTIRNEKAFALYVYDYTSLLVSPFKIQHENDDFLETTEEGYRRIDQTAGFVFETLQKEKKLENTVIVIFGDHGDDLYSHGFSHGFTHAIAPYSSVIRTPLAIYSSGMHSQKVSNLINTTDLRDMILSLIKDPTPERATWDISRRYSFSRNLFWNQSDGILNKAYSVTDGRYMLMASSQGLELYLCKYDGFGVVNLLDFFELHGGSIRLRKEINDISGIHIEYMLKKHAGSIIREFEELKSELVKDLKQMQDHTGIELDYRRWFQSIKTNKQMQIEIKSAVIRDRVNKKMRGLSRWVTRFVS